eukprot:5096195-Amphidinium_carterae.1
MLTYLSICTSCASCRLVAKVLCLCLPSVRARVSFLQAMCRRCVPSVHDSLKQFCDGLSVGTPCCQYIRDRPKQSCENPRSHSASGREEIAKHDDIFETEPNQFASH